jgi:hypothetical protein
MKLAQHSVQVRVSVPIIRTLARIVLPPVVGLGMVKDFYA